MKLSLKYFIPLIAMVCWAGNFPLGRWVQTRAPELDMSALELATWRWTLACLVCALVIAFGYLRNGPEQLRLQAKALRTRPWLMLFYAFCSVTLFNLFVYMGLSLTNSINGLIANIALPSFILGAGFIVLRDCILPSQALGLAIACLGVVWVAAEGRWEAIRALRFNVGDLWIIGGMLIYAIYSIFLRYRPPMSALSFVTIQPFIGLPFLWLMLWASGQAIHWPGLWSLPVWASMAYFAIFPSVVAQASWNRSVELLGSNRASIYIVLIPVIGAAASVMILGERVAAYHLVSFAIVALGLFVGLGLFARRAP